MKTNIYDKAYVQSHNTRLSNQLNDCHDSASASASTSASANIRLTSKQQSIYKSINDPSDKLQYLRKLKSGE